MASTATVQLRYGNVISLVNLDGLAFGINYRDQVLSGSAVTGPKEMIHDDGLDATLQRGRRFAHQQLISFIERDIIGKIQLGH
jgi:hypothetical protein